MSDSITFKYTLTEGDAVRAIRFGSIHSKLLWSIMAVAGLIFAYILFSNVVLALQGQKNWYSALRTLLFFGAVFGAWGALVWYHPVWLAKRWPAVGVERYVTATSDRIAVRSALGYIDAVWEDYTNVLETDHFFMLWMGGSNNLVIPKGALAEDSAVSKFREFLRARFADYRRV